MICLADIVKVYKTTKADSVWPSDPKVGNPCFGRVTAVLSVVEEPHFGGTSAAFDLVWTCSRCKHPFPACRLTVDEYVAGGRVDLDVLAELLR